MSLLLLFPTMPAAGPVDGGWSKWDIGCCCDGVVTALCGCEEVDNYEDDFSDGVLDAGWNIGDFSTQFVEQNNRIELTGGTGLLFAVSRCLVLPSMSAKKLTLEFRVSNAESLFNGDFVTLDVATFSENTVNACRPYNAGMGFHFLNIFGDTAAFSKPTTDRLNVTSLNSDVFRVDMEPDAGGKICKWYVNNVLIRSQVMPIFAGASSEPDLATLKIQWGASSSIHLDDMTLGAYDV